jgi:hypothetical protein
MNGDQIPEGRVDHEFRIPWRIILAKPEVDAPGLEHEMVHQCRAS